MYIKFLCNGLFFILTCSLHGQTTPDSLEIYRSCSDSELGVEVITLTNTGVFYFRDARSYDLEDYRTIGLYKYKEFKKYLESKLNKSNISRIVKVQDSIGAMIELSYSLYEQEGNYNCHRYNIWFYENGKPYKFFIKTGDFWIKYVNSYELIDRLERFFLSFYKEHECENGSYFFYTVKKGESLVSIAKKFSVNPQYLAMYNTVHVYGFYYLNKKRKVDLMNFVDGTINSSALWKDDKLVIPCLVKKKELYEEAFPKKH